MTDAQKIKLGIALVIAQFCLLALTMGFNALMDHQAERAGIASIIQEASK